MQEYLDIFINGYKGYATYLWNDITNPSWNSYFYWLILVSICFFILEVVLPWRNKQAILRKDFWLDGFYMFFNFFLFSLIIYNAASDVIVNLFNDGIKSIAGGFDLQSINPLQTLPYWAILLIGFIVRDFIQWWVHRLLHRIPRLWEYHKVHHSVEQMGFAAHLRYHWMENVVYRSLEYIPLALLGIGLYDFFVIHIFTLAWGHFNHSNISVSGRITGGILGLLITLILGVGLMDLTFLQGYDQPIRWALAALAIPVGIYALGPFMKKIFNSPEMHIWHHSHDLPDSHPYGINFGLTLSCWDWIFGTAHMPHTGRDIQLGFPGMEEFPDSFLEQNLHGFKSK